MATGGAFPASLRYPTLRMLREGWASRLLLHPKKKGATLEDRTLLFFANRIPAIRFLLTAVSLLLVADSVYKGFQLS